MDASTLPGALLPFLDVREAWAVGLVVMFAVLRPVGRVGWLAATAMITAGVAAGAVAVLSDLDPGRWQMVPWLMLAGTLLATVAGGPLRWEPRTGPSAATALAVGALFVHLGAALHAGGAPLAAAAARWGTGTLDPVALPVDAAGPLILPLAWALQLVPGVSGDGAVVALQLAAAAAVVAGVGMLAGRWGYRGTTRATMAAVAWSPPLLLAHATSPGALFAAAALVWSWWALWEVWAGRHRPDRMAWSSGALLGLAVGVTVWPVVVLPLWLGRLRGRRAGWLLAGLLTVLLATLAALLPTAIDVATLGRAAVGGPLSAASLPVAAAVAVLLLAVAAGLRGAPLSPTRSTALSAAVLVLVLPWWPDAWETTGPVAAWAFVALAAVAPDRPDERWPPDASLADDELVDVARRRTLQP